MKESKPATENIALIVAMNRAGLIGGKGRVVASTTVQKTRSQIINDINAIDVKASATDRMRIDAAEAKRQRRAASILTRTKNT